jgi:uncharacterized membrane protein YjjP (DUF1212 family)
MSIIVICTYIVAAALAISRILESSKPYWRFLPTKVAAVIPSVIAMLPVLVDKLGGVKTGIDFVQAIIVSVALLLPGAGVLHPDTPTPPTA